MIVGDRPRILLLAGENPLPPVSGVRLRVLHLGRALAATGEVTVGVFGTPTAGDDEPFAIRGAGEVRGRWTSLARSLRRPYDVVKHDHPAMHELAAGSDWDTVQTELPYLLPAARRSAAPVVLDAHNVESEVLATTADLDERALHRTRLRWEARKTTRFERDQARAIRAVVAVSEADADAFRRMGAREVVVAPNGVDASAIAYAEPQRSTRVVYAGHFGHRPNELAAVELAREVMPRLREDVPAATLTLVGRSPGPAVQALAGDDVQVTGPVDDVLPHLRGAGVTVIPLRAGGGTRLKVLEAMAAGVPVVSTAFGVAGLDVRDGEHLLLAETPRELGAAAAAILADPALAIRLTTAGRALVERRYDWPIALSALVDLHLRIARTS